MKNKLIFTALLSLLLAGCDDSDSPKQPAEKSSLAINAPMSLITSESGNSVNIGLALGDAPTGNVVIAVISSNPSEGTVTPAYLTYNEADWNLAKIVTVTGVPDMVVDGDQQYNIVFSVISSEDERFLGLTQQLTLVNKDIDQPDDVVNPPAGTPSVKILPQKVLMTNETGTSDSFTVELGTKPSTNVTVNLNGSPATECTLNQTQLVFTPENWNAAQTVTVTGLNDHVADGNQLYTVNFTTSSTDSAWNNMTINPVKVVNVDPVSQINGIPVSVLLVAPEKLYTDEYGTNAYFYIKLSDKPAYDVTVKIETLDSSEASVLTSQVVFTPENYNIAQQITIQGVDDDIVDGDVEYAIKLSVSSEDPYYNEIVPLNASKGIRTDKLYGINADDDSTNIVPNALLVTQLSTASSTAGVHADVSENGESAEFSIKLKSAPKYGFPVIVTTNITDTSEGLASPQFLSFTEQNWNVPQKITITGVDDDINDGDIRFGVQFVSISEDLSSNELTSDIFILMNKDNDDTPVTINYAVNVTKPDGILKTSESGLSQSIGFTLSHQPSDDVLIFLRSSNENEGKIIVSENIEHINGRPCIRFTQLNWNKSQQIFVQGQDDSIVDGDVSYTVQFDVQSKDSHFNNLQISPIAFVNADNDALQTSGTRKLRIVSANTTSTKDEVHQHYQDEAMRMFYAIDPDIILIQEFALSYYDVIDGLEDYFKTNYSFIVGKGRIGNGIIVKGDLKIKKHISRHSYVPNINDREYDAAIIDIPGDKDLLAVSLHLYTQCNSDFSQEADYPSQLGEYKAVADFIKDIIAEEGRDFYIVVGGDFNSKTDRYVTDYWEGLLATTVSLPKDQAGNYKTNAFRRIHYDWVLVDPEFQKFSVPTQIGRRSYAAGHVFDTRVYAAYGEISTVPPALAEDSGAQDMQHMPVIRDFIYSY